MTCYALQEGALFVVAKPLQAEKLAQREKKLDRKKISAPCTVMRLERNHRPLSVLSAYPRFALSNRVTDFCPYSPTNRQKIELLTQW